MATAIYPLNKIQMGIEGTKGTLVAATRLIQCDGDVTEEQDFYRSEYPQGVRSNAGGAGTIVRKGTAYKITTELTAEEILWPLETGIIGGVTPSTGTGDYTRVYTPELTTGIPTIKTATVEALRSDGVTNHYYGESGYAMTSGFSIDWQFNQIAKLEWDMFGRARQTDTPTAGLAVYPSREPLITNFTKIYLDTTWAGLGGTQLTGIVRSANINVTTGYEPNYTLDGRADLDHVNHKVGNLAATLSLVLELDAVGAARFTAYRANSIQYIRIITTGGTAGLLVKTVKIDGAYRFTGPPAMSADGQQMLLACELESVYDVTGTKTLEVTSITTLAAIT